MEVANWSMRQAGKYPHCMYNITINAPLMTSP